MSDISVLIENGRITLRAPTNAISESPVGSKRSSTLASLSADSSDSSSDTSADSQVSEPDQHDKKRPKMSDQARHNPDKPMNERCTTCQMRDVEQVLPPPVLLPFITDEGQGANPTLANMGPSTVRHAQSLEWSARGQSYIVTTAVHAPSEKRLSHCAAVQLKSGKRAIRNEIIVSESLSTSSKRSEASFGRATKNPTSSRTSTVASSTTLKRCKSKSIRSSNQYALLLPSVHSKAC